MPFEVKTIDPLTYARVAVLLALRQEESVLTFGKDIGCQRRYDNCMQDRRSEVRMLCADVVEACWTNGDGQIQRASALLEDISPSGACLQFEMAIPLGVSLRWSCPKQEFVGEVRYCVYREIGYFVGVEFEPQSKWSRKTYKPQHLLDLQELIETAGKRGR